MDGKVCIVTGASSGIGLAAATDLAARGARVGLVCRNPEKGQAALDSIYARTGNEHVELFLADLASQAQIRQLAKLLQSRFPKIDVLLNNAGVTNLKRESTVDGIEAVFAVNHLAYFLLTTLLLPNIEASEAGRIVCVASDASRFVKGIQLDDPGFEERWRPMAAYGHSKLANILFVRELAHRLEGTAVTANALHPGAVRTSLGANNGWIAKLVLPLVAPFFRTPEKGAETAIYLATSQDVEGQSGGYYYDCKPHKIPEAGQSDRVAAELWALSEKMTALR